jgi:Uma2 family endonuclease
MAMQTAFRSEERFTQAGFFDWLQEYGHLAQGRYELIDGRIIMTPPAGFPHSDVIVELVAVLHRHVNGRGLGRVLESSAGYELPSGDTPAQSSRQRSGYGRDEFAVECSRISCSRSKPSFAILARQLIQTPEDVY